MNAIVAVVVCLLGMLGICSAVALNGACNAADTCTTSGQTCPKQYGNCVHYGKCQWVNKYNTDACVDSNQCGGGTTCTSSVCACASGTVYNTVLKTCTNLKEYGKACTTNSDCYQGGTGGQAECSSNVCKCKSGYIKDSTTHACRQPYPTEACSAASGAPSCDSPRSIESGIVQATCTSGSCTCPTGSTAKTYTQDDTAYKACFTDVTMVADGATCTTPNQCKYGYCQACPGTTKKICVKPANGAGKPIAGLAVWVAIMTTLLVIAL